MSRSGNRRHAGAVQMPGTRGGPFEWFKQAISLSITLRGLQQILRKLKCGLAEVFPEDFTGC